MHSRKKDVKFDRRASKYDEGFEGKLSQKFYDELLEQVGVESGFDVLDVGCGTGTVLKRISEKANIGGYGIDVEVNMIAQAKKKCPEMDIQLAGCEHIPFDDKSFDVLTTCMAYHHFEDKKKFAMEAARTLKANGCLYIADVRFPHMLRKLVNCILEHKGTVGRFCSPKEIAANFEEYGFIPVRDSTNRYVQVVVLKKVN
ncbi:methyltransferase domain-containing protein [Acetobacterium paludosum]|uniref:Methyltransferase domain-containing protein n=1 Tax=Acetobacterium paludosum TaxID=52693 RepID=A0A923HVD8_9FIRM|nr:methyltransferase domain-containing protein [Acetobacterium paludosum]MBC3887950.1 methyltransferase domain-containing protein [Acetobacterium paludosum]